MPTLNDNMFTLLIVGLIILTVLYALINKRYAYWKQRGVPYPTPSFFGNITKVVTLQACFSDICHDIYINYPNYAYVGFFNACWGPALLIRDPELIKNILITNFIHFNDNWIQGSVKVDPVLAYNPFILPYHDWKTIRSQVSPQFTNAKLRATNPILENVCKNMVDYITRTIQTKNSNCFEVKELSARYTGDTVFSWGYGLEGKCFEVEKPDAFTIAETITSSNALIQLKQMLAMFFPFTQNLFPITFIGNPVPKMFSEIILRAIKFEEERNIQNNTYISFLMKLKTNLAPEVATDIIMAHAFTLFLDGFETNTYVIAYALLELALNRDIQARARLEIETVLEEHNRKLTDVALQDLEYIDNIINETLRKYPLIQVLGKVCTKDCIFPAPGGPGTGKDIIIERGTQVFIPVTEVHNDDVHYPEPNKFEPDRFSKGAKTCFLGFGDGPRVCLGRRFALAQTKMALVNILLNFELKFNSNTVLPLQKEFVHVFMAAKNDILVDFYPLSVEHRQF